MSIPNLISKVHEPAQPKSPKLGVENGQKSQLNHRSSFEENPKSDKGLLAESNDAGNRLKLSISSSPNDRDPPLSPVLEQISRTRNGQVEVDKSRVSDDESPTDGRSIQDKMEDDIVMTLRSQYGKTGIGLEHEDSPRLPKPGKRVKPKESSEDVRPPKLTQPMEPKDADPFMSISPDGRSAGDTSSKKARSRSGSLFDTPTTADLSLQSPTSTAHGLSAERPSMGQRTTSTPVMNRKTSGKAATSGSNATQNAKPYRPTLDSLELKDPRSDFKPQRHDESVASPNPSSIPLPPLSIPAYLQLELSSTGPSPLYIHRPTSSDIPYESSQIKIERLLNFLLLPPQLEQVLCFGTLACLDAWLYTFTILPLRFAKAISILASSWGRNILQEAHFVSNFTYAGLGRMWQRRRASPSEPPSPIVETRERRIASDSMHRPSSAQRPSFAKQDGWTAARASAPQPDSARRRRHRRTKSAPSSLTSVDKADILKGLLLLISCSILMYFDASMMYHSIRGQATIKLYVIYNALEVDYLHTSTLRC